MTGRLAFLPVTLAYANAFVQRHHRHHPPVVGHKFSLAPEAVDRMTAGECDGMCGV